MTTNSRQIFWILLAIFFTITLTTLLLVFHSETKREEPKAAAKLVETVTAQKSNERIIISAYGTVQPNRELSVRSEVNGRIIELSSNLDKGGTVEEGEVLLKLDPRDYLNVVEQEKAAVTRAEFDLKVEKGRQVIAKREWEQLNPSIMVTELSEELALRKPHLEEKKAALDAAKSRLEKAEIDLERTILASPMNAIVTSETVEVGDYITPQTEIAKLVATDTFRVQVSVPASKLRWIDLPKNGEDSGSAVRVIYDLGGFTMTREGKILRLLGDLDPSGRMARILVAIDDPLSTGHPLLLGTYVEVEFEGPLMEGVYVLPREALRGSNEVWVKNWENELEIREVNIVQKREDVVCIDKGIEEGEEVVISHLSLPIPGMELRTAEESE